MNKALSLNMNMPAIITESPQFFTATILEWKKLLKPEKYKDIITSSLQFLVDNNRTKVNAFVIMDNHIHLIWQMMADIKPEAVQRDFMKFTAQKIKQDLIKNHPAVLAHFKVNAKDREYQFWERNALSVELNTLEMLKQKLEYIPVRTVFSRAGIIIRLSLVYVIYQKNINIQLPNFMKQV